MYSLELQPQLEKTEIQIPVTASDWSYALSTTRPTTLRSAVTAATTPNPTPLPRYLCPALVLPLLEVSSHHQ